MGKREVDDMEAMLQKVSIAGALAVDDLARRIAREAPNLAELAPEQLEKLARVVLGQRLARDLDRKADIAGIDYQAERETFLKTAGKTKSVQTLRAYASALERLEGFTERSGFAVLAMKPREADDYAYSLIHEGRASASIRRDLAAASSFFTFLERRSENRIKNPFRGTKARPEKKPTKEAAYPSETEAAAILEALEPATRAAVAVMLYRGLRVGAMSSLAIRAGRFVARSKGKDISGELPAKALEVIRGAGLDTRKPFATLSAPVLSTRIIRATTKLAKEGIIAAAYSAHDFRHLYAVTEYRKDRDLYRVSKLLSHASIQVTETYLHGLGEVD
ncbi:MAG: site-specific integrase [Rectinemataceae bacterium]|jgi:site-specific recombinase XerD